MSVAIITGAAGLIGGEAVRFFADKGFDIAGIDNDMRRTFFGADATTAWYRKELERTIKSYVHFDVDVRDRDAMTKIFSHFGKKIAVVIHAAAQPSHDWAASDPMTDFTVNALATLTLLELTRAHCPDAPFLFLSTNKVYGDTPNRLPLVERDTRWEVASTHAFAAHGIDETMSIDRTTHSLFGVSKTAADLMVQEFGRYFGMKTACFRCGCMTGSGHSGTQLHGFLSYLMKCTVAGRPYTVFGHKGKQVRDNIHSYDLVNALWHFFQNPRSGEIYNIGGSRFANCSVLEAIELCEDVAGRSLPWRLEDLARTGDHIWWISDVRHFQSHYPGWRFAYGLRATLEDVCEGFRRRDPVTIA
jgi:CDP-paratose 2-epimerase